MNAANPDAVFAGSIPQVYDRYLVPLIFEPYAADLCRRVEALQPARMLEIAAGTGVVTRQLARALPRDVDIVATDLNAPMLAQAARVGTARPVEWRQADAMELPFPAASFDLVVCQFGAMFFPDKARAFAEVKRVLRPGGTFIFSAWDRIETSEMIHVISLGLDALFPDNPPRLMHRGPHGYHDTELIAQDVIRGGFARPRIETRTEPSRAPSARHVAVAYCEGTPMRNELEAKGPDAVAQATEAAAAALVARYGEGPIEGPIRAHIVTALA